MNNQIRIGIVGYGNLGREAVQAIKQRADMKLIAIFTRRSPDSMQVEDETLNIVHISEAEAYKDHIDVMILCGGSATDLPEQGPFFAHMFNTVDSYDTHAKIPEYFSSVDEAAKNGGKTSVISVGWDPGLFSLNRMLGEAMLPKGETYTFWGEGVSQGHSDAIRRIKGVKDAIQYTVPIAEAMEKVRRGELPTLSTREKHLRECYVVLEKEADPVEIERQIKTMPNYFADYETTVTFISESELKTKHAKMKHGGFVIRSGKTGDNSNQIFEFSLKLDSNPAFTSSVLVTYARAAYYLNKAGDIGAKTVYDIAPKYLSDRPVEDLRRDLL
ncbi:diaminopimelate dehydrogenase [Bacillus chungangensis]|uniref:Meso-diaminopimelate D-dehydrogenase n=1 Tax=Bacillus chungangensis TaxID=587633 RepID=A0ABT9WRM2_9BACI|nr:diaminopimelate dehydrogenase [Bacillus chungangensis]MDQ0175865.1 diaminopimelate dehydrogenase [Bacillus chungangensis]